MRQHPAAPPMGQVSRLASCRFRVYAPAHDDDRGRVHRRYRRAQTLPETGLAVTSPTTSAWQRIRLLRARAPGRVSDERMGVFASALEQSEQLMRAARDVGPAACPLPLFYALSQAGRAIAAAHLADNEWRLAGGGLSVPVPGSAEVSRRTNGTSATDRSQQSTLAPTSLPVVAHAATDTLLLLRDRGSCERFAGCSSSASR